MSGIGPGDKLNNGQVKYKNDYVLLITASENGLPYRCGFVFQAVFLKERAASVPYKCIQKLRSQLSRQQLNKHIAEPAPPAGRGEVPRPCGLSFDQKKAS